jgi:hypothetical protein
MLSNFIVHHSGEQFEEYPKGKELATESDFYIDVESARHVAGWL